MALTHQEFMGLSSKSWVQDPHANPFKHLAQLLSLFFFSHYALPSPSLDNLCLAFGVDVMSPQLVSFQWFLNG